MTKEQGPAFLYPPGSPLMHPPLALDAARMYGFWVAGSVEALQASIDATLNRVAAGRMRFHVVTRYVLLTFTAIEYASSCHPEDRNKGWGEETDIAAWVFVVCVEEGALLPSGFYGYPLHIWVDNCMALINGRDLYGYPKYKCRYSMPEPGAPAERFHLAAKGFEPYAPESKLALHPLLTVTPKAAPSASAAYSDLGSWQAEVLRGLHTLERAWEIDEPWLANFREWFRFPALDQIFLKQLPDASGTRAVYQAVVTAPARVKAIRSVHMLASDYRLELHRFASFPLDRTLGWKLGIQEAHLGFKLDFDFVVEAGEELVNNSKRGSPS